MVDVKLISSMTEMRLLNMLGPPAKSQGVPKPPAGQPAAAAPSPQPPPPQNGVLAVAPLCVTFNGANAAWRHAKAVHYYGSGLQNWRIAMCKEPPSRFYGSHAIAAGAWRAAGMCDKHVSRARFVRFLRDPFAT